MMTPEDVARRVKEIAEMAGDDEAAHSAEDALHTDVLQAIKDGKCDDPAACAGAALETLAIEFSRWCA